MYWQNVSHFMKISRSEVQSLFRLIAVVSQSADVVGVTAIPLKNASPSRGNLYRVAYPDLNFPLVLG